MVKAGASFWLIAPYAAWMALMAVLPATAAGYAVRTVVVAALLAAGFARRGKGRGCAFDGSRQLQNPPQAVPSGGIGDAALPVYNGRGASPMRPQEVWRWPYSLSRLVDYFLVGLLVFLVWILPEQFDWAWYRRWCIVGEGGTRAVAEAGAALIALRLVGSAFVISVAEELFFRKWLIGFAGFGWTVALFAVEHDRWLVGAAAGVVYGLLYVRRGLLAAVVAHATTNLALGLWVLATGQWRFW